jgi:hypothetical protein
MYLESAQFMHDSDTAQGFYVVSCMVHQDIDRIRGYVKLNRGEAFFSAQDVGRVVSAEK